MAECQALLNPKDSYSCRWGLGSGGVSANRFNHHGAGDDWGDLERENASILSSNKLWQSTESSVYDTEAEDVKFGTANDNGGLKITNSAVKYLKNYEVCCNSSVGSSEDFSIQYIPVEIQPFANEPINGPELIAAVMRVRCCGLLRWEMDDEKPHNRISLHFTIAVDKEIFDVHNLALEMDQALTNFATCSVAVKATGSQTHHYLVGGATKSTDRRPSDEDQHVLMKSSGGANNSSTNSNSNTENKPPSRLRRLLKSRSFLGSLSPFNKSTNGPNGKLASAGSTQSLDGLTSILQEIATELKTARKEIRDVQSHVYFLSRHISNLTLERPNKQQFQQERSKSIPDGIINADIQGGGPFRHRMFGLDSEKHDEDSSSVSPSTTFNNPLSLDVP